MLSDWFINNKLHLNISQTKIMYFYKNTSLIKSYQHKHLKGRFHIINRPRLPRDYKIDDISLNTYTNRFKFKPHITNIYIHIFGKKSTSNYALEESIYFIFT